MLRLQPPLTSPVDVDPRGGGESSAPLPRHSLSRAPSNPAPQQRNSHPGTGTYKPQDHPVDRIYTVLLVDDSAEVRELVRMQLSRESHLRVIAEARDGFDAVRQARDLRPDLVVLDLYMPTVNGWRALPQLRAQNAKVVVLSSFATPDDVDRALALGASEFIVKGIPRRAVVSAVNAALGCVG